MSGMHAPVLFCCRFFFKCFVVECNAIVHGDQGDGEPDNSR